ncbi:MAG: hypothetical protein ACI92I_000062 [Acidimicrobiales bacterium]|jgi:hypothetical protein
MQEFPKYLHTAGKITVLTSFIGVVVFAFVFLLNLGAQELQQVEAQGVATTSITVLNTPPQWTIDAQELFESSTTTPTNSGDTVSWTATGADSNGAPYFLLICNTANLPTPNAAAGPESLGTAPPDCSPTSTTQWAVSTSTPSGSAVTATTTTSEGLAESNDWYAWICDDDPVSPRCSTTYKQGTATTASPFNVNHRPVLVAFSDDSPGLPGNSVTFYATSSDSDVVDAADTIQLHVCSTASFSATSTSCNATTLATSTFTATQQSGAYTIVIPTRDQNYGSYGYIVDNHGHVALGGQQGADSVLTVANATPFVSDSDITLNNGADMTLTVEAGETTGMELYFNASDNNSCLNASAGDELVGYEISVFRSNLPGGWDNCDASGEYDANDCYTSTVPTTTWNVACTASTTSCLGATDLTMRFDCTFPLWYIADPTDGGATNTVHFASDWSAAVAPVDDNFATGTLATSSIAQDVVSFLALVLDTAAIPFGSLEPGDRTDPLVATTTVRAVGNVGMDQMLSGQAMCGTYTSAITCPNSSSSTIQANYQVFATSSVTYGSATSSGFILSSSTPVELEIDIKKSTSTATQSLGVTFWGIEVPVAITLAGAYTGENTFTAKTAEPADW